ncbi:polyprotein [Pangolin pestivirus]|nr:polyprotein [Pangolin pestivirus]URZ29371.1 polyprotein [Pangolin pestivirus]URZ29372.1 polyprotein [Pangolin pestivirus]
MNFEIFFRVGNVQPRGAKEPVYDRNLQPLFGTKHEELHPQSTLVLPHVRGRKTQQVKLVDLPTKGDCERTNGEVSGIYVKPGPIWYSDYEGPVYHRIPLELCAKSTPCSVKKLVGRMEGSDTKLYHVYTCPDGCIFFTKASKNKTTYFMVNNALDAPLWVQSCSDTKPKNDKMVKGKITHKPKEVEKDTKKKAPDATIVVEGVKYQVTKKGKVKSKKTEDGLYHNKNKPPESRKKLEKALLAWAILCSLLIIPVQSDNVTQWNLWDNNSIDDIHLAMFKRGVNRSLHGIWPKRICKGVPGHLAKDYELKLIDGMMDSSGYTNYTCCKLQRHEWNKHGWCNWFNIDPWLKEMNQTQHNLTQGQYKMECAVTCRYDNKTDLNIVLQARDSPTMLTGCKKGKNYSFSGEIRNKPCSAELGIEDLMLSDHTCHLEDGIIEAIVDDATELVEKARKKASRSLSWAENKLRNIRLKLFGAEASPYCNISKVIGNIVYTSNCTPACLPSTATIIGPGAFDLLGGSGGRQIYIPTGVQNEMIILTIIAASDYLPETASVAYVIFHYLNIKLSHPLIEDNCDKNQLNLTINKVVSEVVPKQFYFLGAWSCIKPSWWPYWSEAEEILFDLEAMIGILVRLLKEATRIYEDLTAVAFIAGVIKLIQGKPVHALIWLLILSGVNAQDWDKFSKIKCKDQFKYALAKGKHIGLLGASNLTTQWEDHSLDDGQVAAICENGRWVVTVKCKLARDTWLAEKHERALPTSVKFISIHNKTKDNNRVISKPLGVCDCNASPKENANFNAITIVGSAFHLTCPYGWKGNITCHTRQPQLWHTEIVETLFYDSQDYHDPSCLKTKTITGKEHECILGGNTSCVAGQQISYTSNFNLEQCNWCGYTFTNSTSDLPKWPIGQCKVSQFQGLVAANNINCTINGVEITTEGTVECMIGTIKVKTRQVTGQLLAMPCQPIRHGSDTKYASGRQTCTFNYSAVLPKKYYKIIDNFWQQYIVKDGYQYWFDLEAGDHRRSILAEYIVIVIVALLGGKVTLWILVAYHLFDFSQAYIPGQNSPGEFFMYSTMIIEANLEVVSHFLLLLALLYNSNSRNLFLSIYFLLTSSAKTAVIFIILCLIGSVKGEDLMDEWLDMENIYLTTLVVVSIVIIAKKRNFCFLTVTATVLLFRTAVILPTQYSYIVVYAIFVLFYMLMSIYYFGKFRKIILLFMSFAFLYGLIGLLNALSSFKGVAINIIVVSWPRLGLLVSLYLSATTWTLTTGVDVAGYILGVIAVILTIISMSLDVTVLWTVIPWYNTTKLYYIKRKVNKVREDWKVKGGVYETLLNTEEGVHQIATPSIKAIDPLVWIAMKSIILAAITSIWKPVILAYCIVEMTYWLHIKLIKELAGMTNTLSRIVASIIEISWSGLGNEVSTLYKTYILSTELKKLIIKHKVNNPGVRRWFKDEEIFGMPKIYMVTTIKNLTKDKAILCSVCENSDSKRICPKCGSKGTPIKCGMTLSEFEEKFYTKIFISDYNQSDHRVEGPGKIVRYLDNGLLYLRNLPILATKQKMLIVGNLGCEIADLEYLGWTLRGPAVCKKITHATKCQTSILDKLTAFFGIMPRGATPRAPTRFPVSLLKIKRGFENGWAYTHPGGISSVHHVTEGKDMFVSDDIGRTKIVCQSTNKTSDETEYGIKTDSACPEGTRCYAFNPEATNISGTKGAMVHLRKAGGEFNCITAMGTPAYFDLKHLKGWSGLPIFEAGSGKIVGRVKAGKNQEGDPTVIMSGVQVAKPTECNLESIASKIAKMQRGEFKQVTLATGAGKTTELPRRVIEEVGRHKRVLVLIPLRAAAEGVYRYMKCKYPSISFNLRIGELKEGDMATGITYASYGYFCQMEMPKLKNAIITYNYVFLDEYHCATAEQLAVMSKIHRFSEEVRIVAMTATPAGTVSRTGQKHTIEEVQLSEVLKGENLGEEYINIADLKVPTAELKNNCLVFVPTRKLASENAKNLASKGYNAGYFFSGEDPTAIRNITAKSPYIVVATNAIESGVTLPDLDTVIDTGLKYEKRLRINEKMPYIVTGLKRMAVTIGEQAQRKGRVGRVKPGRYLKGPTTASGEKDYHYDLLQAQMYGVQDGINITKSFREMNYDWCLYEMDTLMVSQLEVLNNVILSRDLPIATKNMLTRTTHPEPIQLVYNCSECPIPVLFPIVKSGEVTDKFETYELMNSRKLNNDPPAYLYSTEDEDLVIDLLNLKWPDPTQQETIEAEQALKQLQGLSTGETALLVTLFGWVGYQALTKRHIPIITNIYQIEDQKLEDTTHMQYAPDDIHTSNEVELENLKSDDISKILEKAKECITKGVQFIQYQSESIYNRKSSSEIMRTGMNLWEKIQAYLQANEKEITKYGLWGTHTAFYNSIKARLGHETALATLIIKWVAFGEAGVNPLIKQVATDLIVYYIMNRPNYDGDTETQKEGKKFVAATMVSALASYTFNNYSQGQLKELVEPALSYLPYASKVLSLFTPTRLESCIVLSTAIYKTYLGIKKGKSDGLAGVAASAAMELMNQNPISIAIAVALGVGGIAAHNAIESSETKRTLLMKVFVKNFLDQAATDELIKENPEKIILSLFEAVQTVGNPIRLIYHLYAIYFKGWSVKEVAEKTAGRNLFTLVVFDGLEMLGLDKEGSWRNLSNNYLLDAIDKLLKKITQAPKTIFRKIITSLLPAPFSCTTYDRDCRIGWQSADFDEMEVNCACGYTRKARKNYGSLQTIEESGPQFCRNRSITYSMGNIKTTVFKKNQTVIPVCAKLDGLAQIYYNGCNLEVDIGKGGKIIRTAEWEVGHKIIERCLENWQGIKYGTSSLGNEPFSNKDPIIRTEATITKDRVVFTKMQKGCAYTKELTVANLKQLIHLVHKRKLPEVAIPEVHAKSWISEPLIDENLGTIKPKFGETIVAENDDSLNLLGPDIVIDDSELQVNPAQGKTTGRIGPVSFELSQSGGDIKLGLGPNQHPGKELSQVPLFEKILAKQKPYTLIFGNKNRVSNRSRTGNFNQLVTDSKRYLKKAASEGQVIFIQVGNQVHESLQGLADYVVPFLTRDLMEAFSQGGTKKRNLDNEQLDLLLGKSEGSHYNLPNWLHEEEPKFLEINLKGESYHLVGNIEHLKERAKELGATKDTKVQTTTTKGTYIVNLSSWWDNERVGDLEPLLRELTMKCTPTNKIRQVHYASPLQISKGNLLPLFPEVWQGLVPVKKQKIHPYEAYITLLQMVRNKKTILTGKPVIEDHNKWIMDKIRKPSTLNLKNLVSPGALDYPIEKNKKKYNIYNSRIGGVMQSIGINLNKLPVVRAQVDSKSFHDSIRDKIDKKPNPQNPDLHRELLKVFEVCKVKELQGRLEEVDWQTLDVGLNRKGAPGFLEKENIGELASSTRGRKTVEDIILKLKSGKHIKYYETAIPKNEKRAVTDDWLEGDYVEEKKPRVIQYPEAKTRLAITKVMYNWVKQKPILIPGYEGKTPIFNIFNKVHKEWKQFRDPVAVSFDTKAWDTQVTPDDLALISQIQKFYFKKEWHKFIDTLTKHMLEVPVITEDGQVYLRIGQRGSGQPDTSAGNSMLNVLTMIYCFCVANDLPYSAFPKVAKIHVCGDDGFLITEKGLGEKFSRDGPQLLYEAGKPQKLLEESGMKLAYRFEDIEFCSHTPIQVRWTSGLTSYAAGRETATILAKMSTRLDSTGERGSEEYEKSVAFSFLLLYFWNPLVRRICLRVLGETGDRYSKTTVFYCTGDPIGAFTTIYGYRLDQLDRTDFKKLSQLNLSMSMLQIWKKNTSQRLLRDCILAGGSGGNRIENSDRLVSKKTGQKYAPGEGYVMQGRHYEELEIEKRKEIKSLGIERYVPGPIKTIITKRFKVLSLLF